jgi:hypothetical protein
MALVNANGLAVLDLALCMPLVGAWHADLRVDTPDALTGPVTIEIDDGRLVLRGTVWRGSAFAGTSYVRVVAGADGLRKPARAKHYSQASVRIPLTDLLAAGGETLSPTSSSTLLARHLDAWTTAALPIGRLISRLLASAQPGASWRMLPNGQLWVGVESWPDSGFTEDVYQILDENPAAAEAFMAPDAPLLLPGTTLAGRRVSRVEHTVNDGGIRSKVWFESTDRLREALAAAVQGVTPPVDYFACYWARVVAQHGATIDVEIENPTIAKMLPPMGGVPLTMPAPGATVQMSAVGRVLIGWSGGDPSKPYALAPDAATGLLRLTLNSPDLRLGDDAAQPFPNGVYRSAEDVLFKAILTAAGTAASATLDAGAAAFFAALVLALNSFQLGTAGYLTKKAKAS